MTPIVARRNYAGLFLVALATLMYEVLLTRVFSVTMWYHFAFMAISIAMFGMTFGAVAVYLRPAFFTPERRQRHLSAFSTAFAFAVVLSFLAHLALPWLLADGGILGRKAWLLCVAATFLVTLAPFICGGIAVTLALTGLSGQVGRLYAADLAGAALGCLAILGLLTVLDGPSAMFCVAAAAAAGAVCFAPKARSAWAGFLVLSALAALSVGMARSGHPLIQVRWTKARLEPPPLFETWNSFSRLRIEGDSAKPAGRAFGWGLSPSYIPARPVYELSLNIDASAATPLTRFSGDTAELEHLKHDVTNMAHHLRRDAKVLVVGVGGGRDVLSALAFGQKSVLGVELNGDILKAVNGRFGDFTGHFDRNSKVTLINDEARSYVARVPDRFDILQVSLVDTWAATSSGAFVLSESSLYTVEAWDRFLDRLTPGGILSFSRWYYRDRPGEMYRLVSLAAESLRRAGAGAGKPRDHMLMARLMWPAGEDEVPDGVGTLLVGRRPFTAEDAEAFRRESARLGFDVALTPTETLDTVFASLTAESGAKAFLKTHPLDLSAPTDDRPFFFHMLRLRKALDPELWKQGAVSMNLTAVAVLAVLLGLVFVLTALAVILPLRLSAGRPGPGTSPLLAYFLAIGLAFMLVEIAQMQRLNLFLGHPTFALSTVLFTLLLAGGTGSWLSSQAYFAARGRLCLGFLLAATAAAGLLAPALIDSLQASGTLVRVLAAVSLLFPMGLGMGMAFPMGMRWASGGHAALGPWLWGVNGAASVCASVLAIALSMTFGISATYWAGFACYAVAAAAWLRGNG